jgi:hypothetical protein
MVAINEADVGRRCMKFTSWVKAPAERQEGQSEESENGHKDVHVQFLIFRGR